VGAVVDDAAVWAAVLQALSAAGSGLAFIRSELATQTSGPLRHVLAGLPIDARLIDALSLVDRRSELQV
jgi:hypothetical protein